MKGELMFADRPPLDAPHSCPRRVLVLEEDDFPCDVDDVVRAASAIGSYVGDDNRIYWIVFMKEPGRAWDFTEESLRSSLNQKNWEVREVKG